jgi:hypothetical protein
LGRPASGPLEWKDRSGRRLKELREQASVDDEQVQAEGTVAAATSPRDIPLKLHEAMAVVLRENGNAPMTPLAIAAEINSRSLYRQRSGARVPSGQISARLSHYQDLFERTHDGIRLRNPRLADG